MAFHLNVNQYYHGVLSMCTSETCCSDLHCWTQPSKSIWASGNCSWPDRAMSDVTVQGGLPPHLAPSCLMVYSLCTGPRLGTRQESLGSNMKQKCFYWFEKGQERGRIVSYCALYRPRSRSRFRTVWINNNSWRREPWGSHHWGRENDYTYIDLTLSLTSLYRNP